jgi:hypothetical protein
LTSGTGAADESDLAAPSEEAGSSLSYRDPTGNQATTIAQIGSGHGAGTVTIYASCDGCHDLFDVSMRATSRGVVPIGNSTVRVTGDMLFHVGVVNPCGGRVRLLELAR